MARIWIKSRLKKKWKAAINRIKSLLISNFHLHSRSSPSLSSYAHSAQASLSTWVRSLLMLIIESIENLLNRVYNIFKRNQRRKHKHHKIIAINRRRRSRCLRGALCLHRAASAWAEINIKMFSSIAAGNRLQWLISSIDHVIHQASSGNSSSDVTKPLAFLFL